MDFEFLPHFTFSKKKNSQEIDFIGFEGNAISCCAFKKIFLFSYFSSHLDNNIMRPNFPHRSKTVHT